MKLKSSVWRSALAGALVAGSQAQAASILVIDDSTVCAFGDGHGPHGQRGVPSCRPAAAASWIPGWARGSAFTTLTAGDRVETVFCAVCGQAHFQQHANSHGTGRGTGPVRPSMPRVQHVRD